MRDGPSSEGLLPGGWINGSGRADWKGQGRLCSTRDGAEPTLPGTASPQIPEVHARVYAVLAAGEEMRLGSKDAAWPKTRDQEVYIIATESGYFKVGRSKDFDVRRQ